MDTKLLYHFCELFGTEILSSTSVFWCKPPLSTLHQLLQLSGMCPWNLKYFGSPLDVFAAPVLFPDLAEKKKRPTP